MPFPGRGWDALPPQLQPDAAARPPGLQWVKPTWVFDSIKLGCKQMLSAPLPVEGEYAPPPKGSPAAVPQPAMPAAAAPRPAAPMPLQRWLGELWPPGRQPQKYGSTDKIELALWVRACRRAGADWAAGWRPARAVSAPPATNYSCAVRVPFPATAGRLQPGAVQRPRQRAREPGAAAAAAGACQLLQGTDCSARPRAPPAACCRPLPPAPPLLLPACTQLVQQLRLSMKYEGALGCEVRVQSYSEVAAAVRTCAYRLSPHDVEPKALPWVGGETGPAQADGRGLVAGSEQLRAQPASHRMARRPFNSTPAMLDLLQ